MAKQRKEARDATTPPRTFQLIAPEPAKKFSGTHPVGVEITDGVGETDDGIKAHAIQEYGFTVLDKATGQPAWPDENGESKADA